MAVKKRDLHGDEHREQPRQEYAPPHETGIVEAESVAHGAVLLVRLVALLLWLASLLGTYVPLAGGWEPVLKTPWPPALIPACIAGALQLAFTWAQWSFKSRAVLWWRAQSRFGSVAAQASVGWWMAYLVALLLSALFSIVTYGQWIAPMLTGFGPPTLGWIVVGIAAILADMLPEWIIVRG